jgi:hypothetical protein
MPDGGNLVLASHARKLLSAPGLVTLGRVLTLFGAAAVTFMMLMYALEHRDRRFVFAFGCGCVLSSAYGFLAGTWPFGVVELIWAGVAFNRYRSLRKGALPTAGHTR